MGNKGELLRQRIIAAADQLFYQQGYESTSFSDIAAAVDISRGNFYYHFKCKEEILAAVITHRSIQYQALLNHWDTEYSNPKQRILQYLNILTVNQESIKKHGCPTGSLCTEMAKAAHTMRVDINIVLSQSRDWLSKQFSQLNVNDPESLAMHFLARTQGIATITNAFEDKDFLCHEVRQLSLWLDEMTNHIP